MSLVTSIETAHVAQEKQGRANWARTVRKESPPGRLDEYLTHWEAFFDHYADHVDYWHHRSAGYHKAIASLAGFYVPPYARVLEVGSGNGDLLAALKPSYGVGIDISGEMVRLAARKHPHLDFRHMAAEDLQLRQQPISMESITVFGHRSEPAKIPLEQRFANALNAPAAAGTMEIRPMDTTPCPSMASTWNTIGSSFAPLTGCPR